MSEWSVKPALSPGTPPRRTGLVWAGLTDASSPAHGENGRVGDSRELGVIVPLRCGGWLARDVLLSTDATRPAMTVAHLESSSATDEHERGGTG